MSLPAMLDNSIGFAHPTFHGQRIQSKSRQKHKGRLTPILAHRCRFVYGHVALFNQIGLPNFRLWHRRFPKLTGMVANIVRERDGTHSFMAFRNLFPRSDVQQSKSSLCLYPSIYHSTGCPISILLHHCMEHALLLPAFLRAAVPHKRCIFYISAGIRWHTLPRTALRATCTSNFSHSDSLIQRATVANVLHKHNAYNLARSVCVLTVSPHQNCASLLCLPTSPASHGPTSAANL